jgi:hypothetical protein
MWIKEQLDTDATELYISSRRPFVHELDSICTVENVEKSSICTPELDSKKIQQFSDAIESSYWFNFS